MHKQKEKCRILKRVGMLQHQSRIKYLRTIKALLILSVHNLYSLHSSIRVMLFNFKIR